jgi:hypothetical protein
LWRPDRPRRASCSLTIADLDRQSVECTAFVVERLDLPQDLDGLALGLTEQHCTNRPGDRTGGRFEPLLGRREVAGELVDSAGRDLDLVLGIGERDTFFAGDRLDPAG